jgi:SAM-dependent methyltransferase
MAAGFKPDMTTQPVRSPNSLRARTNMATRQGESWRPQLHAFAPGGLHALAGALRRFLDLQSGSIWRDVSAELPDVRGTALDVGCGAQPFRPLFHPSVRYIGIDTADAKAHFDYEIPDTRYYHGRIWPVADASVDFVLCTETLEHVYDTRQFLGEARRCLAPAGRILITVPFAARWHYIPYDYWRFTPSSLANVLAEAGFTGIVVCARGNEITVACYKVMALILPLLLPQGKSPLASLTLRLAGILFLPLFFLLAICGNLSLRGAGGDDCLGYTVVAARSAPQ